LATVLKEKGSDCCDQGRSQKKYMGANFSIFGGIGDWSSS